VRGISRGKEAALAGGGCDILEIIGTARQRWRGLPKSRDIPITMARQFLLALLILLLGITLVGTVQRSMIRTRVAHPLALKPQAGAMAQGRAGADWTGRPPLDLPKGHPPGLDSLGRAGVRLRLGAEAQRHYLDSLCGETDSIVRRWTPGDSILPMAIVSGGAESFQPEMIPEVRDAFDQWHPGAVGLRFLEQRDTTGARLLIHWVDTLESNRAGATDITWDRTGRIHHVVVALATRSPTTGRPFSPAVRRTIALHELGHALGLPHSWDPQDVMHPIATAPELTDRDRFSLRLLYELPTGWIGTADTLRGP
jgi:hypothetical protein